MDTGLLLGSEPSAMAGKLITRGVRRFVAGDKRAMKHGNTTKIQRKEWTFTQIA